MYFNYYHLSAAPFSLVPNKEQRYIEEEQYRVLDYLNTSLDDDGISSLIGVQGVGKTLLLQLFVDQLESSRTALFLENIEATPSDLYQQIAQKLNLKYHAQQEDLRSILTRIKIELLNEDDDSFPFVLIFDDAHLLHDQLLQQLCFLDNLDHKGRKLFKIFIAGDPSLYDYLQQKKFTSLQQRLTTFFTMEPLNHQQSRSYLEQNLLYVDGSLDLFTPKALQLLLRYGAGRPLWLSLLTDRSLKENYKQHIESNSLGSAGNNQYIPVSEKCVKEAWNNLYCWKNGKPFQIKHNLGKNRALIDDEPQAKRSPYVRGTVYLLGGVATLLILCLAMIWSFLHYPNFYEPYKETFLVKQINSLIQRETEGFKESKKEEINSTDTLNTVIELGDEGTIEPLDLREMRSAAIATGFPSIDHSISEASASIEEQTEIMEIIKSTDLAPEPVDDNLSTPIASLADSDMSDSVSIPDTDIDIDLDEQPQVKAYNIALFSVVSQDIDNNPILDILNEADELFATIEATENALLALQNEALNDSLIPSDAKLIVDPMPQSSVSEALSQSEESELPALVEKKNVDPVESVIDSLLQNSLNMSDALALVSTEETTSNATESLEKDPLADVARVLGQRPLLESVIPLDKMPLEKRKALPLLAFEGYIYTPNFKYNWVTINGKQIKEGEMITNYIQLVRIDPKSVVIYFDDLMIRIPSGITITPVS